LEGCTGINVPSSAWGKDNHWGTSAAFDLTVDGIDNVQKRQRASFSSGLMSRDEPEYVALAFVPLKDCKCVCGASPSPAV
jgi:hypothetical protein